MSKITIHAGDFKQGKKAGELYFGTQIVLTRLTGGFLGMFRRAQYDVDRIASITEITGENMQDVSASLGWGVAGLVTLGPLAALAAGWAGGKKHTVTFHCKFDDGKQFIGTTSYKAFGKLAASSRQAVYEAMVGT